MSAMKFKWDDLRTELLRRLWGNGHLAEIIAKALGAPSSHAVMLRARRDGLGRRMRLKSGRLTARIELVVKEKAKPIEVGKIQKERTCLQCLRTFMSLWNGNRICPDCKSKQDGSDGTVTEYRVFGGERYSSGVDQK